MIVYSDTKPNYSQDNANVDVYEVLIYFSAEGYYLNCGISFVDGFADYVCCAHCIVYVDFIIPTASRQE